MTASIPMNNTANPTVDVAGASNTEAIGVGVAVGFALGVAVGVDVEGIGVGVGVGLETELLDIIGMNPLSSVKLALDASPIG